MREVMVAQTGEEAADERADTRARIVQAAARLLAAGGREAVSTRAVAAAAGVQPPTIYRQFGDMRGLLDAVAAFGFSAYLGEKTARERGDDPVEELRRGWNLHVGFGLANPAFYTLMYADPRPASMPTAARETIAMLHALVSRVAEAGRLRVGVEQAVRMIHAAGMGVTLALIATEPGNRDLSLPETTREAILAAILTDGFDATATGGDEEDRAARRAIALKAVLAEAGGSLTPGEQALLSEWLDRIAASTRRARIGASLPP